MKDLADRDGGTSKNKEFEPMLDNDKNKKLPATNSSQNFVSKSPHSWILRLLPTLLGRICCVPDSSRVENFYILQSELATAAINSSQID